MSAAGILEARLVELLAEVAATGVDITTEHLHAAVVQANAEVQAIGYELLAGNANHSAADMRTAIAAPVWRAAQAS